MLYCLFCLSYYAFLFHYYYFTHVFIITITVHGIITAQSLLALICDSVQSIRSIRVLPNQRFAAMERDM